MCPCKIPHASVRRMNLGTLVHREFKVEAYVGRESGNHGIVHKGVGGIVVAGVALLVAFQEKLIYVPVLPRLTKSYQITPARCHLLYEDVWLTSFDGVHLHA